METAWTCVAVPLLLLLLLLSLVLLPSLLVHACRPWCAAAR